MMRSVAPVIYILRNPLNTIEKESFLTIRTPDNVSDLSEAKPAEADFPPVAFARRKGLLTVSQALKDCLAREGIANAFVMPLEFDKAVYSVNVDPFDGSETLIACWRDEAGIQQGEMQLRSDDSLFAEVNVVRQHPYKPQWFVEGVTAWGTLACIKTELKLLAMP